MRLRSLSMDFRLLPGDLTRESFVKTDAWLPAEMPEQFAGVGAGEPLVAGPGRFAADDGPAADDLFELGYDLPDRGGFAAAYVVHLTGTSIEGGNRCRDAIFHVGVAANLKTVAVNGYGFSAQQGVDEAMIAHVGSLPGTIDGEVAQDD